MLTGLEPWTRTLACCLKDVLFDGPAFKSLPLSAQIGSGLNGSACGPTKTAPPRMLQRHGACADDNFGFMSRGAAQA